MDLGCGNGLLVYILTAEGFDGTGVDIRKRKIWDAFKPKVDLQVRSSDIIIKVEFDLREKLLVLFDQVSTVHPSATTTFPKYTWLIGNHSDELTPWIPVMAAITSHQTRFFVLPCCPFEFNRKFTRRNPKSSIYRDYLDYVKEVGAIVFWNSEIPCPLCRWSVLSGGREMWIRDGGGSIENTFH